MIIGSNHHVRDMRGTNLWPDTGRVVKIASPQRRLMDRCTPNGLQSAVRRDAGGELIGIKAPHSSPTGPALRTNHPTQRHNQATPSTWPGESTIMQVKFDMMRRLATAILYPLACVALTTALLLFAVKYTTIEFDQIIYLIPVVICAVRW